jgi:hypothetical protein
LAWRSPCRLWLTSIGTFVRIFILRHRHHGGYSGAMRLKVHMNDESMSNSVSATAQTLGNMHQQTHMHGSAKQAVCC